MARYSKKRTEYYFYIIAYYIDKYSNENKYLCIRADVPELK